jgi:Kef-type K+ transport system membrane component KefB
VRVRPDVRRLVTYSAVIGAFILAIALLLRTGDRWFPAAAGAPLAAHASKLIPRDAASPWTANLQQRLPLLIVQLLLIISLARVCGRAAASLRQPPVMGEIAAGIMLGPSLLGHFAPGATAVIFPEQSLGVLRLLGQIGVILYMFRVGLDVSPQHVRHRAQSAVAVSHFSIVTPFLLGVLAALVLFRDYAPPGVTFRAFALFMGIAMSITAFPVLARVLEARGLSNTPLGSTALTCAAVDDLTAWTMLAFVVTLVTAGGAGWLLAAMLIAGAFFVLLMTSVIKSAVARVLGADRPLTLGRSAIVLGVAFASALFTELLGIHALFGAFLAGAIMPPDPKVRAQLRGRIENAGAVFLLPLFFTLTGLRTNIALLDEAGKWMVCALLIAVATAGKLGGSMLAARWTGSSWHDSFVLGALMNTRGLMELIALNVGYELGILSAPMFTMLVLMALVTTVLTGPLIDLAGVIRTRWAAGAVESPAGG